MRTESPNDKSLGSFDSDVRHPTHPDQVVEVVANWFPHHHRPLSRNLARPRGRQHGLWSDDPFHGSLNASLINVRARVQPRCLGPQDSSDGELAAFSTLINAKPNRGGPDG
jgi:hypothetical protein